MGNLPSLTLSLLIALGIAPLNGLDRSAIAFSAFENITTENVTTAIDDRHNANPNMQPLAQNTSPADPDPKPKPKPKKESSASDDNNHENVDANNGSNNRENNRANNRLNNSANNRETTKKPKAATKALDTQAINAIAADPEFNRIMQVAQAQNLHERPMSAIMQAVAKELIGATYVEGMLDVGDREQLVLSLRKFDCVLFVETVLAISRGVAVRDYTPQTFASNIQSQRYLNGEINGEINGYCSRLHYFSGWIKDNQKRGNVQNVAQNLGGIPLNKSLNFMSQNWQLYPKLLGNAKNRDCIAAMEKDLGNVQLEYIPSDKIRQAYNQLQPGDIVAIATDIPGLDVTHTGLVYRHADGNMGMIHASPVGTVVTSADLQAYVSRQPSAIGILVARPIDPR